MVVLLELDQQLNNSQWNNAAGITDGVTTLSPGIWRYRTTIGDIAFNSEFNDEFAKTTDTFNKVKLQVGSFNVDNTEYTEVSTFANLESQNESFYWDATEQTIYVHFDGLYPYYVFTTKNIGYVIGFCQSHQTSGYTTETGVFYSPALKKAPIIRETADSLFYGILQNPNLNAELDNSSDHSLDDIATRILFGAPCRIKAGSDDDLYTDFDTIFTGRVRNIPSVREDIIKLQLQTDRAFLSKKLPFETYDQTTYTNLADDDLGKPIPLIFGKVLKTPCVNIDAETTPTNYTYKICTVNLNGTAYYPTSVQAVYADGIEITPASTSNFTTDGTVELAGTDVKDGSSFFDVAADVTGYQNDNALEVIRILADEYLYKEYIAANYNLVDWAEAESSVSDIGIVIGASKKETFQTIIENICLTVQGNFKVQGDGKYTFLFQDEDKFPVFLIEQWEQLERPEILYDSEEYLSTATCGYAKRWDGGESRKYEDETQEEAVLANYRVDRNKVFETLLINESDAVGFAESTMNRLSTVPARFPTKVFMTDELRNIQLFDNGYLCCNRQDREFYGYLRGVITEIRKDYNKQEIIMSIKWKSDATIEDGVVTSDFIILDGGDSTTDYDIVLENGDSETQYTGITLEGDFA